MLFSTDLVQKSKIENNKLHDFADEKIRLLQHEQFEPRLSGEAKEMLPAPEWLLENCPVLKRANNSRTSDEDASLIEGLTL